MTFFAPSVEGDVTGMVLRSEGKGTLARLPDRGKHRGEGCTELGIPAEGALEDEAHSADDAGEKTLGGITRGTRTACSAPESSGASFCVHEVDELLHVGVLSHRWYFPPLPLPFLPLRLLL